MTKLSPAAQAVLDAAYREMDYAPRRHVQWVTAAALRAAADQVVPVPRLPYDSCCDVNASAIRAELLAIAIELETQ
jgi:hypothetical protein